MSVRRATHGCRWIAGLLALVLGGCAAAASPVEASVTPKTPPVTPIDARAPGERVTTNDISQGDLDGAEFLLVSARGFMPIPGVPVRLAFQNGGVRFTAGCNICMGGYTLCEGKLCFREMACTGRGCPPELSAQDDWLAEFLAGSPQVARVGDRVVLSGSNAILEFLNREVANPDRPLVGPRWTIQRFLDSLGQWGFALQADPTVEFRADGNFAVSTGCCTGQGRYVVKDETLTLSSVRYGDQACPSDEDERAQKFVEGVLKDGEVKFAIGAERLRLVRGDLELLGTTK